jgi:tetratricopeptide (TPR) repeat protein
MNRCTLYKTSVSGYFVTPSDDQYLIITKKINDRKGESIALCNLGTAYFLLDDLELAIEYYQKSLTIVREIGDRLGEGKCLNNLGKIFFSFNQLKKAEKFLHDAIVIWENIRVELVSDADKISIFETQVFAYLLLQKGKRNCRIT